MQFVVIPRLLFAWRLPCGQRFVQIPIAAKLQGKAVAGGTVNLSSGLWFQLHGKLGMYNSEQQSCPRHLVARTWARLPAQGYALLLTSVAASVVVADEVAAAAGSSNGSHSLHMGELQDRALHS